MEQIGEEKRRRKEEKEKEEKKRKKRRGKGERKRKKKGSKRRAEARNQNVPSAQSSISPRAQHIGIMPAWEILLLLYWKTLCACGFQREILLTKT